MHTVDSLQVSHGFANLQGIQGKGLHLQVGLVLLKVVSQLQKEDEKSGLEAISKTFFPRKLRLKRFLSFSCFFASLGVFFFFFLDSTSLLPLLWVPSAHLSIRIEFHNNPCWLLLRDANQFHNVGMVHLFHEHCRYIGVNLDIRPIFIFSPDFRDPPRTYPILRDVLASVCLHSMINALLPSIQLKIILKSFVSH